MNPIITADQLSIERTALSLLNDEDIQDAIGATKARWEIIAGRDVPAEASGSRFDELLQEYCFAYILKAINSDSCRPRVLRNAYGPPHSWFGMDVPGCRAGGGDNVDNDYAYIPIDGYSTYRLHGKTSVNPVVDVPITISGNVSQTMPTGGLDWQNIEIDPDGQFEIIIGPKEDSKKLNCIQTTLDSQCLFMRDCRSDWDQIPNSYVVERLSGPEFPELTKNQIVARARQYMLDSVPTMYWWMRVMDNLDLNSAPLVNIGSMGGLSTQKLSLLRLNLTEDDTFIIRIGTGNARYRSIILHDYWFRTFDYWSTVSTRNNAQTEVDSDGSITYVISKEDLGCKNWLDTGGFKHILVCVRWQGMPATNDNPPWIEGELVKVENLKKKLPEKLHVVTSSERVKELEKRKHQVSQKFRTE